MVKGVAHLSIMPGSYCSCMYSLCAKLYLSELGNAKWANDMFVVFYLSFISFLRHSELKVCSDLEKTVEV